MRIILPLVLFLSSIAAKASETTLNPLDHAETRTAAYAEGKSDMEPYGLDGCDYINSDDVNPEIECSYTSTILVWGGHEVTSQGTCTYKFKKRSTGDFEVLSSTETCGG